MYCPSQLINATSWLAIVFWFTFRKFIQSISLTAKAAILKRRQFESWAIWFVSFEWGLNLTSHRGKHDFNRKRKSCQRVEVSNQNAKRVLPEIICNLLTLSSSHLTNGPSPMCHSDGFHHFTWQMSLWPLPSNVTSNSSSLKCIQSWLTFLRMRARKRNGLSSEHVSFWWTENTHSGVISHGKCKFTNSHSRETTREKKGNILRTEKRASSSLCLSLAVICISNLNDVWM